MQTVVQSLCNISSFPFRTYLSSSNDYTINKTNKRAKNVLPNSRSHLSSNNTIYTINKTNKRAKKIVPIFVVVGCDGYFSFGSSRNSLTRNSFFQVQYILAITLNNDGFDTKWNERSRKEMFQKRSNRTKDIYYLCLWYCWRNFTCNEYRCNNSYYLFEKVRASLFL